MARFYQIFKVHKPHSGIPPGRPIISGCNSLTQQISRFLDFHLKPLVQNLPSYLQDTPDFLRQVEELNRSKELHDKMILVTIDVTALYTNIRSEEGVGAVERALNLREDQAIPTEFLTDLLNHVLSSNIFEFDKKLYKQMIGTAMGTSCAPSYANIFMGEIDEKILALSKTISNKGPIIFYKRYIDDIFLIWDDAVDSLTIFLDKLNYLHPTLRFSATFTCPYPCDILTKDPHTCFCSTRSLPFLDTLISIKNGMLSTDLYRKPTDRCLYLLPSSCHPNHITKNIPYSLCYRILRICSDRETFLKRIEELKSLLISRNYKLNVIEEAIVRISRLDRKSALQRVVRKTTERSIFTTTYHPALPSFTTILNKSWKIMVKDPYLREVFPQPPMVAYRQPRGYSLRELLVKSKIPPQRQCRAIEGMSKCNKEPCSLCPFVDKTDKIKNAKGAVTVKIKTGVNCETRNVVYAIYCNKRECSEMKYIGETMRTFRERFKEHLEYVRGNNQNQAVGKHFNLPGHSISNMRALIIEHCKGKTDMYRKIRELFYIQKLETCHKGMNAKM